MGRSGGAWRAEGWEAGGVGAFACVSTAQPKGTEGPTRDRAELPRGSEGPFCMLCHVEETVTGDARENAKLKTARAAREVRTVRNIMGILRHSEGV